MSEPVQLKEGKLFQQIVQNDFCNNSKDGKVIPEKFIILTQLKDLKNRNGRIDIFIDKLQDCVVILEIKATDWDKIKQANIHRNLYKHQKQIYLYIDKYLAVNKANVCIGIIYPSPPQKEGLRKHIEEYMENNYSLPVYWYNEIKS